MKKAIVHLVQNFKLKETAYINEIRAFSELYEKYKLYNIILFKGNLLTDNLLVNKFYQNGIILINYYDRDDLNKKIIKINNEYKIKHLTTASEFLINTKNNLLRIIGKKKFINRKIFRDKYIQRDLLQKSNSSLGIGFLKLNVNELNFELLEKKIGLPFILKPINGVQSAGVKKIENKQDFINYITHSETIYKNCFGRGFKSDIILAEEYIDGQLYSVDYFVTKSKKIFISKPVKVKLGIDIGINDYFNLSRIVTQELEDEFKDKNLKGFVEDTVKATGIKSTFVHHEFKINLKGQLKTIELNGRIGGGRLEVMNYAYGINLFDYIFENNSDNNKFIENVAAINIYSKERGILKSYNENLFSIIEKRKSTYQIRMNKTYIGKEVGLTLDGFTKLATIKIKNKNLEEFNNDLKFIEDNYNNFLIVEKTNK